MPIFKQSRYNGSSFVSLRFQDGQTKKFVLSQEPASFSSIGTDWIEHVVQQGEELDYLAHVYGGDESLWWLIAEVNNIIWPWDIKEGTRLVIPMELLKKKKRK